MSLTAANLCLLDKNSKEGLLPVCVTVLFRVHEKHVEGEERAQIVIDRDEKIIYCRRHTI